MKVLLAEDDPASRALVTRWLQRWGHRVLAVADGEQAWEQLRRPSPPPVAILDWLMPGCDGLELVQRVRQIHPSGVRPHLIMLTQQDDSEKLVAALEAGADDYMTKPAQPQELRARLSVARRLLSAGVQLQRKSRALARYGQQMHQLAEARARQLHHADRLVTIGTLAAGVAHEISNPAAVIAGNIQTLQRVWSMLDPHLQEQGIGEEERSALRLARQNLPAICRDMQDGVDRVARIVRQLTHFSRRDVSEPVPCDLNECVRQSLQLTRQTALKGVEVRDELQENLPPVLAAPQEIEQVIVNLLVNAGHAVDQVAAPRVTVRTRAGEQACVQVEDNGPGIAPAVAKRLWDPFFTTRPAGKGTGLGLAISRTIAERYSGSLTVCNRPEGGACFELALPVTLSGGLAA